MKQKLIPFVLGLTVTSVLLVIYSTHSLKAVRRELAKTQAELASMKADRYNLGYILCQSLRAQRIETFMVPFEPEPISNNWNLDMRRTNGMWMITIK